MLEERLVECGNLAAGGAVDKDAIEDVHLDYFFAHMVGVSLETGAQDFLVVVEVDAVAVKYKVVNV